MTIANGCRYRPQCSAVLTLGQLELSRYDARRCCADAAVETI
jgi:hypothetical protein